MATKKKPAFTPCRIIELPPEQRIEAARYAISLNPNNGFGAVEPADPAFLAGYTAKFWPAHMAEELTVYMDTSNREMKTRTMDCLNRWRTVAKAKVRFREVTRDAVIRIGYEADGHWSYLGVDILNISANQRTMNLQLTARDSMAEWTRVATHEGGHTLAFAHEHLRRKFVENIVRAKALAYFRRTQGWDDRTTVSNVLTPLEEARMTVSPTADEISLMAYQLPGEIMRDGRPIRGGADLSAIDIETAQRAYPGLTDAPPPPPPGGKKTRLVIELDGAVTAARVLELLAAAAPKKKRRRVA